MRVQQFFDPKVADEFARTPGIEIKFVTPFRKSAPEGTGHILKDVDSVWVWYKENTGKSREQEAIEEFDDLDRIKEMARQILEDTRKFPGKDGKELTAIQAWRELKNEEERRVFLMEFYVIGASDGKTVAAILSPVMIGRMFPPEGKQKKKNKESDNTL